MDQHFDRRNEIGDDVLDPDRLREAIHPKRRHHHRQPIHEGANHLDVRGPGRLSATVRRRHEQAEAPAGHELLVSHVERQYVDGEELSARRLWLCETRNGRIVEATGYCTGEWDAELRGRHAVEAPMLRP